MSINLKIEAENFGKGIGNLTRQGILEVLFDKPSSVSTIVKGTQYSQPLISQHLKILKQCKLVKENRVGKEIIYELNTLTMKNFINSLSESINDYENYIQMVKSDN